MNPVKDLNKFVPMLCFQFKRRGAPFDIRSKVEQVSDDTIRLKVKFEPDTRAVDIRRCAEDVRRALKLSVLEIEEEHDAMYIIVSKHKIDAKRFNLINVLRSSKYSEAKQEMTLAHPVGVDVQGIPIIVDIPKCWQILVSGTTGSGKSVALRCFLTTLASQYSSEQVNLLIGDSAYDLPEFDGIPHLSGPIIKDFQTFLSTLLLLDDEMNRRLPMKNTPELDKHPFIIFTVDEFNLLMGDAPTKYQAQLAEHTIANILRMGRHVRIHLFLVAHNPGRESMKVRSDDLPTRLAFKVASSHQSVTALGTGGAEKLQGNGDLLFKMDGKIRHIQGMFISPKEATAVMECIKAHTPYPAVSSINQHNISPRGDFGFTITRNDLDRKATEFESEESPLCSAPTTCHSAKSDNDRLLANVIAWALTQEAISCNQISEGFNVGWRKANNVIRQLNGYGIVGELDAKLPREVLIHSPMEIPAAAQDLLRRNGFDVPQSREKICHTASFKHVNLFSKNIIKILRSTDGPKNYRQKEC